MFLKTFFKNTTLLLTIWSLVFSGLFPLSSLSVAKAQSAPAKTFWQYQCIDTMKYSRDTARAWQGKDAQLQQLVQQQLGAIKNLGANCVAIDTPYDPEFWPFMKVWVDQARADNLVVWFRGNMSGWEGWFNYPLLTSGAQQNQGVTNFITSNPDMFQNGDMFTPAPEAENGILGNPFSSPQAADNLRNFLESSYANCVAAFAEIGKNVRCGLDSANGDVAKDIYTKDMIAKTGNVVVVDDYVATADKLATDIENLHKEFGVPVMLGEFGAPIPDIHGNLTDDQQADLINQMMSKLYQDKDIMFGVNYWVISGGSTALLNDDGSSKPVVSVMQNYYQPVTVSGTVSDNLGDKLAAIPISSVNGQKLGVTDENGAFSLLFPANIPVKLFVGGGDNSTVAQSLTPTSGKNLTLNFMIQPSHPGLVYVVREFIKKIFDK